MNDDFDFEHELPEDFQDYAEYDPVDKYERSPDQRNETDETDETSEISNDKFLEAIFGKDFVDAVPLVCRKFGDPDFGGWTARPWPCLTKDNSKNWYFVPSTYTPDESGKYRAKKEYAGNVHCTVLDDVGTKVSIERLVNCTPSWLIKTSPNNYQAGFIFKTPVTDHDIVDELKEALIEAGLCDSGATGGTARWARLPVGINGRPKYGEPSPQCKLTHWSPDTRYTVEELYAKLSLVKPNPTKKKSKQTNAKHSSTPNIGGIYTPRSDENQVIANLKRIGLYKTPLGDGKHDITCPWVSEHTDQLDTGAGYFEPSDGYPIGGFKCFHSHGPKYHIRELLEFLSVPISAAKNKSKICVEAGELDGVCDAGERELAASGRYYQRGNLIARISTNPETGVTSINPLSQPALTRALSNVAVWTKYDKRSQDEVICDPPSRHVSVIFDAQSYTHLPYLSGLARQPHLRKDLSVVMDSGYDLDTKLFGVFDTKKFQINQLPRRQDAEAALAELNELLDEFDFASSVDRTAVIAGMLTATIRTSLVTAPMFHVRAPQVASGKSYLCSIIAAFSSASSLSAMAFPTNDEECQKLLLATLLESPASIFFDNINTDIFPYKSLCSALTEEHLTGRILGVSKTATVGTRTLFLGSGNNVGPIRDMSRRCITINLDPKVEMPAARDFVGDPLQKVRSNREHFVCLALTIIRGWVMAGEPETKCKSLASYTDWSRLVRQPLLWLGMEDPANCIFEQLTNDPDRELLGRLLHAWHEKYQDKPMMIRDVVNSALFNSFGQDEEERIELREILKEIAEERGVINRRRLGKWISRHKGRLVDEFRFEKSSSTNSAEKWMVKSV